MTYGRKEFKYLTESRIIFGLFCKESILPYIDTEECARLPLTWIICDFPLKLATFIKNQQLCINVLTCNK